MNMNYKSISIVLLVVLAIAGLGGCAANAIALMKGPSGDTVLCKVDPWGSMDCQGQVDDCAALYAKAGYKEVK